MKDVLPYLTILLWVHIVEWVACRWEHNLKDWSPFLCYRYTEKYQFALLTQNQKYVAKITFWVRFVLYFIVLNWMAKHVLMYKHCQPMLAVCFFQDFGVTIIVQIFVLLEQFLKDSDNEALIKAIISNEIFDAKRHFFRLRYICTSSDPLEREVELIDPSSDSLIKV